MGKLEEKVALVTGGASGIGQAIARAFAEEGAAVAIGDRNGDGAEEIAAELAATGARSLAIPVEVTHLDEVTAMVERTIEELGGLHVLVVSHGIGTTSKTVDMSADLWQEMIDVNLTAVFYCAQAVMRHMMKQRSGRIILLGSQLGLIGATEMAHYCAAKAGVHGFAKALARELAPYGVTVNAIAPGPTDTPLLRRTPTEWLARKRGEVPLRRFARVEEIAPTAVLLASAGGSYYTGAIMNVSGGDAIV